MATHQCSFILLVLFTTLTLGVTLGFYYLLATDNGNIGLYRHGILSLNLRHRITTSPADWTTGIWVVIFVTQVLWMAYAISTLCRRFGGRYVYQKPKPIPSVTYVCYILASGCVVAWTFLLDHDDYGSALAVLVAATLLLYLCLAATLRNVNRYSDELVASGHRSEIIAVILLVHNGLGLYASWLGVSCTSHLSFVLIHYYSIPADIACSIGIGVLTFVLCVWFVLDQCALEKYLRYLYAPHVVPIWFLLGVVFNGQLRLPSRNSVMLVVLLMLAIVALVTKMLVSLYYAYKQPLYSRGDKSVRYITTIALR